MGSYLACFGVGLVGAGILALAIGMHENERCKTAMETRDLGLLARSGNVASKMFLSFFVLEVLGLFLVLRLF